MVEVCGDDLAGLRDRAWLVVGFAGALRRSELAALTVDDVEDHADGIVVVLHRSKPDQEARADGWAPLDRTRIPAPCGRSRPGGLPLTSIRAHSCGP
jgi:integrase